MNTSLLHRLIEIIHQSLASYPGAWLVWCDARGDWLPLLERAAASPADGFPLLALTDETANHFGGPQARQQLQQHLDAGQSIVLVVPRSASDLGWLWAQALLAERIVDRPRRDQPRDSGRRWMTGRSGLLKSPRIHLISSRRGAETAKRAPASGLCSDSFAVSAPLRELFRLLSRTFEKPCLP